MINKFLNTVVYAETNDIFNITQKVEELRHVEVSSYNKYILEHNNERMDFNTESMHGIWKSI